MNLSTGALLHNNTYRIERVLGQGGFGITYLAEHVILKKKVAIKEFFPKAFCDRDADTSYVRTASKANSATVEKLRNKFIKEAEHIAKMDSPYIVRIIDVFEENHTAYYIMDYIEGRSLSDIVKKDGQLPVGQAVEYIAKIGEALTYIHSKRMNHLDVKPANIMVRAKDNTPILIDFGLSKQYDSEGNQTSTTPVGISHGYAPIEQYRDGGVKEFSPQTDLYSLAATLYYLLSGVVPPQASTLVEDELTFPDSIPANLIRPIAKAMSSKRSNRHESISEFIKELNVSAKWRNEENLSEETIINEEVFNNISDNNNENILIDDTKNIKTPNNKAKWIITVVIIAIAIICLIPVFLNNCNRNNPSREPASIVKPELRVSDINDYLTLEQQNSLNHLNDSVSSLADLQIVSMILKNSKSQEFKHYTDSVFNAWGVGDSNKNNGVLIGIDVENRQIAVSIGSGVSEPIVNSRSLWDIIVDSIQFYCKKGDYFNALKIGSLISGKYMDYNKSGYINGHSYVDLGLPSGIKWSTTNLGSVSQYDGGDLYEWGNVTLERNLDPIWDKNPTILRNDGILSSNSLLNKEYDAAAHQWGNEWSVPSDVDFKELIKSCEWIWSNEYNGYKIIGPNGNSMFLPSLRQEYDRASNYWTCTPKGRYEAYVLSVNDDAYGTDTCYIDKRSRDNPLHIRPVAK